MTKNKKIITYNLSASHAPLIILITSILALGVYFSTKAIMKMASGGSVLGSETKNSNSEKNANAVRGGKPTGVGPTVDYEPKANSRKYKANVTQAVTELEDVANKEKKLGNSGVSTEIQEVATTEEDTVNEVTDAIDAVESRSKWQDLVSPDYKNLGQLRSSLAHNTNSIRKLTAALTAIPVGTTNTLLQDQLLVLHQERERIVSIINQNESQFSILGWVVKLLTGYDSTPIGSPGDTSGSDSGTEPSETLNTNTEPVTTGTGL